MYFVLSVYFVLLLFTSMFSYLSFCYVVFTEFQIIDALAPINILWVFHGTFIIFEPCLFVCFVALHPKSTAMVMVGRSVHLDLTTLFPEQA